MIVGVDGEGYDLPDGRHVYVYLCAAGENGKVVTEAYNTQGLSTAECVECLSRIPARALCFGFMFSYDVTKIIEVLTTEQRYYLMRPELRARGWGKRRWRRKVQGFDYFAGSLSHSTYDKTKKAWKRDFHIWDVFKFFGTSFVKALELWQIGTEEERERIAEMKGKRGEFDVVDIEEVKRYCRNECVLLARMMRKVIESHDKAGIKLRRYEGAGSTAAALLRREKVMQYKGRFERYPRALQRVVFAAYFGGRFENSTFGEVKRKCLSRDINSAYPAVMQALPCLKHGRWERTKSLRKVEQAALAFCQLSVSPAYGSGGPKERERIAWLPLPCRTEDGSIIYGLNFSGWYHKGEALAALAGWPELVRFRDAWIYRTECDCAPFDWIQNVYAQRLEWGKDGPGIVLKLGLNASYGKLAQHIGVKPEFQSWVWAGAVTAGTRARMLGQLGPERWDVLAIATDGCLAEDNGTRIGSPGKPLGAWDEKELPEGVVLVKPGVYWRRDGDEREVRARGIGRAELFKHRAEITAALRAGEKGVTVVSRRFFGAKSTAMCFSYCRGEERLFPGWHWCPECAEVPPDRRYRELVDDAGKPVVGQWAEREIRVDFAVMPKRDRPMRGGRLRVVDLGGIESTPYRGQTTPEGQESREAKELLLEQADWED